MNVTFYGAAREVTGSMHLVSTDHDRILLDCGLHQGRRREAAEKNRVLPFDPAILSAILLSHAHADHSGRVPLATRNGFTGRVLCTAATRSACAYLLPDSASIQESDAAYLNYKTVRHALTQPGLPAAKKGGRKPPDLEAVKKLLKKNRHELKVEAINRLIAELRLEAVEPLYTLEDARRALTAFEGCSYRRPVSVGAGLTATFYDAGHILGSAIIILTAREGGRTVRIGFTGDLGRFDSPVLRDPELDFAPEERALDLLILESTYGNRVHEPVADLKGALRALLAETFDRGGTVLIPAFAFGRTQVLLYLLHELHQGGEIPPVPIYVDSPLATHLTEVFANHPEGYDREAQATFLAKGENPFVFDRVHFVRSVEESMALNRDERPQIIIAASGMCEAGRILHHLRFKIHNPRHTVLIVGYMAQNTLGRRIEELGRAWEQSGRAGDPPLVRFLNKDYPLRAHVAKIGGFSAHADRQEMLRFLERGNLRVKAIALVHGEEEQCLPFAEELNRRGFPTVVPRRGETLRVG